VAGGGAKVGARSLVRPGAGPGLMPPSVSPYSLEIHSCELLSSALKPLPGQGLSFTIADSFIQVQGRWKVRKSFL
jgi:hypothetical protein